MVDRVLPSYKYQNRLKVSTSSMKTSSLFHSFRYQNYSEAGQSLLKPHCFFFRTLQLFCNWTYKIIYTTYLLDLFVDDYFIFNHMLPSETSACSDSLAKQSKVCSDKVVIKCGHKMCDVQLLFQGLVIKNHQWKLCRELF